MKLSILVDLWSPACLAAGVPLETLIARAGEDGLASSSTESPPASHTRVFENVMALPPGESFCCHRAFRGIVVQGRL